jgi:hypothetical protein
MRIYTVVYAPREHALVASNVLTRVRLPVGREPNSCQPPFGSPGCVKSNGATLSRDRPPGWFRQVSPDEFIQTKCRCRLVVDGMMRWRNPSHRRALISNVAGWVSECDGVRLGPVGAGGKGAYMDEKWSQDVGRGWRDSW